MIIFTAYVFGVSQLARIQIDFGIIYSWITATAFICLDMGKGSIKDLAATLGPLFLLMLTKEYADLYNLPKEVNPNPGRRPLREILQPDMSAREEREARAATGRSLIELGVRNASVRARREAAESYSAAVEEAAREAAARQAAAREAAALDANEDAEGQQ
ncbi:hypothetical protein LINPERPRIM_LOCUS1738 [Linum perenne]